MASEKELFRGLQITQWIVLISLFLYLIPFIMSWFKKYQNSTAVKIIKDILVIILGGASLGGVIILNSTFDYLFSKTW